MTRLDRTTALAVFDAAVAACDPETGVRQALGELALATRIAGRRRFGVAIGKAAIAMARGAGPVHDGIAIAPAGDGSALPAGWRLEIGPHPFVTERSVEVARIARAVIGGAMADDVVLALMSGGSSALVEQPRDGITLSDLADTTRKVMEAGAPIEELNVVRTVLSRTKGGGLVASCRAPVITLAVSDVIGDDLATIGSGPTVTPRGERHALARAILAECRVIAVPAVATLLAGPEPAREGRREDHARVIAPIDGFARGAHAALEARGLAPVFVAEPVVGDVAHATDRLVRELHRVVVDRKADPAFERKRDPTNENLALLAEVSGVCVVAWGEPTVRLPTAGLEVGAEGGRAQQVALSLARAFSRMARNGIRRSALVIGSDGIDGPPPRDRPAPAGAFVDETTWDTVVAAGIDPDRALAHFDAGTALHAAGALVVTGPTGTNHADLVVIG